jgi:glyoxylase-like metal-dependent hydrolase (beta-lactamase superfamily II)
MGIRAFAVFGAAISAAMIFCSALGSSQAQQPVKVETVKIADGVYIYRWGPSYQSLFVVTPEGVVVTDPINAAAATAYLAEIRKITSAPIRYVVYSHHHYDHIVGGAIFKEAGATFIAHRNARPPLERLKHPQIVMPDELVDERRVIELGGARIELLYVGRNHTDNSLILFLPSEKIVFAVDFIAYKEVPWRGMFDAYLDEWKESLERVLALDWDQIVVGHSRLGGVGTKADVRAQAQYMADLKEIIRVNQGKCIDEAMKEIKLPQYEDWTNYQQFLPLNVERMCHYWRFGYQ